MNIIHMASKIFVVSNDMVIKTMLGECDVLGDVVMGFVIVGEIASQRLYEFRNSTIQRLDQKVKMIRHYHIRIENMFVGLTDN